jgi:hypothetical protein
MLKPNTTHSKIGGPRKRRRHATTTKQLSTPLLDKLQLAAIDQMRQAIAGHIGIEAFGL